jgi:hypothetical protein
MVGYKDRITKLPAETGAKVVQPTDITNFRSDMGMYYGVVGQDMSGVAGQFLNLQLDQKKTQDPQSSQVYSPIQVGIEGIRSRLKGIKDDLAVKKLQDGYISYLNTLSEEDKKVHLDEFYEVYKKTVAALRWGVRQYRENVNLTSDDKVALQMVLINIGQYLNQFVNYFVKILDGIKKNQDGTNLKQSMVILSQGLLAEIGTLNQPKK